MHHFKELFQFADWKQEKHVPVIEVPEVIKKEEKIEIKVSVGKEIPHPNTMEHHIAWIDVFFLPEGEKFPYHLGRFEFLSHGALTYSDPEISFAFKTEKSGELFAFSFCNLHGLWAGSKKLNVK